MLDLVINVSLCGEAWWSKILWGNPTSLYIRFKLEDWHLWRRTSKVRMKTGPGLIKTSPALQDSSIKNPTSCCSIDLPRQVWVTGRVKRTPQGIHKAAQKQNTFKNTHSLLWCEVRGGYGLLCYHKVEHECWGLKSLLLLWCFVLFALCLVYNHICIKDVL